MGPMIVYEGRPYPVQDKFIAIPTSSITLSNCTSPQLQEATSCLLSSTICIVGPSLIVKHNDVRFQYTTSRWHRPTIKTNVFTTTDYEGKLLLAVILWLDRSPIV